MWNKEYRKADSAFDFFQGRTPEQEKTHADFLAWVETLPPLICGLRRKGPTVMDEYGNLVHVWKRISQGPAEDVLRAMKSHGEE